MKLETWEKSLNPMFANQPMGQPGTEDEAVYSLFCFPPSYTALIHPYATPGSIAEPYNDKSRRWAETAHLSARQGASSLPFSCHRSSMSRAFATPDILVGP